jgi:Protein of unknown function (DUF1344)
MRRFAGAIAAAAVIGAASLAYAATSEPGATGAATGQITGINAGKHSITLDNRSTFFAPHGANLANLRIGEKVTVPYVTLGGIKDATQITP